MEGVTLFGGILEHLETNLQSILENREANQNEIDEVNFDNFMQQYKQISSCAFFESN